MNRRECKVGQRITFEKNNIYYFGQIRELGVEDVFIDWLVPLSTDGKPLPASVGPEQINLDPRQPQSSYRPRWDVLEEIEATKGKVPEPEQAPVSTWRPPGYDGLPAEVRKPFSRHTGWDDLWHRFTGVCEERKQIKEQRARLMQSELPTYELNLELMRLDARLHETKRLLEGIKVDVCVFLQTMSGD